MHNELTTSGVVLRIAAALSTALTIYSYNKMYFHNFALITFYRDTSQIVFNYI